MVQAFRRQDIYLRETKVIVNVLVFRLIKNPRKSHWIRSIFVNTWVQRRKIHIADLFIFIGFEYRVAAPVRPSKNASRGSSGGTNSKCSKNSASSGSVSFCFTKSHPTFQPRCIQRHGGWPFSLGLPRRLLSQFDLDGRSASGFFASGNI